MKSANLKIGYKLKKKEIKKLIDSIPKLLYISDKIHKEKFKQVLWEGKLFPFIVSSAGRVFSIKEDKFGDNYLYQLKPNVKRTGYTEIVLSTNSQIFYCLLHRIVGFAFIKNDDPINKIQINHKNGDKLNNWVYNLEWITPSDNIKHAYSFGLIPVLYGERNVLHKFSEEIIHEVCRMLEENKSCKYIAEKTDMTESNVYLIRNKKSWAHITKNYDFSNYTNGKDEESEKIKTKRVHKICKMLEENKLSMTQIANEVGVSDASVRDILVGNSYKYISCNYNIQNYTLKSKPIKKRSTTIS